MAGLTADDITKTRQAAGAAGSPVIPVAQIATLFNDAMTKHGGGWFSNKKRVAALVSECLMESANFRTSVEYASTGSYQPYRGRTFIQLTWKSNYAAFGAWCLSQGLLTKAQGKNYFVNNPVALGQAKWAALGDVWYFTTKKWDGKNLCQIADSGSSLEIGRAVNLGSPYYSGTPNGQAARDKAYKLVMGLPDSIVPAKPTAAKKVTEYKLWTVKPVRAYNKSGKYVKTVQPGKSVTGYVDATAYAKRVRSHGRYFRFGAVPHRLWLPLDNGCLSHTKNGKAIV